MRLSERAARDPDLAARLIAALQQALHERRLDVADVLLRAIEIHGTDRTTEVGYRLVARMAAEASRPVPKRRSRGH